MRPATSFAPLPFALAVLLALGARVPAGAETPASAAGGAEARAGDLTVSGAWARQPPPGARAGAAYLTVRNAGTEPDRLLGGSAPGVGRVEIHSMAVADGVMRMAPLDGGLAIAPGASETLAPGGNHVMLLDPAPGALRAGEALALRLEFERAGAVALSVPVLPVGARGPVAAGHGAAKHAPAR